MNNVSLKISSDVSKVTGELTRQTVIQISKKSIKQLISQSRSILNLQEISHIDTAGLAWLFSVLEQANKAGCQLTFSHIPAKLTKLISLSGVDGFLPIAP